MRNILFIIDMDGTLTDSRWRNHLSPRYGGSWKEFHENCHYDDMTTFAQHLNKLFNAPSAIDVDYVISTARPEYTRINTEAWLNNNMRKPPLAVYYRADNTLKSPDLKKLHLDDIRKDFCEHTMIAFDDREDVCQMFIDNGVLAFMPLNFATVMDRRPDEPKIVHKTVTLKEFADSIVDSLSVEELKIAKENQTATEQKKEPRKPERILSDASKFYEKRNKEYGDVWKQHGEIMAKLFPDGITLKTPGDFNRYQSIMMDIIKLTRIGVYFSRGEDHPDSWNDIMVYSAFGQHLTEDKDDN